MPYAVLYIPMTFFFNYTLHSILFCISFSYTAEWNHPLFFLKKRFYLFLEREEGREKEKERDISV